MGNALARVNAAYAATRSSTDVAETRFNIDPWIGEYLLPPNQFNFGATTYPFGMNQTYLDGTRAREIANSLPGYMAALRSSPPAFAAQMIRAQVISGARFTFRNNRASRSPGRLFGTTALAPLEQPWPNATTGELLSRMEWHAGLTGNAYVTARTRGRLRILRPDWVVIVYGSHQEPDDAAHALDGELLGYAYTNGGLSSGSRPQTLLPDEVAHFSPIPDPECAGVGMSWITPGLREIQGDTAATDFKLQYFRHSATPNMIVKGITAATKEQFDEIVDAMEAQHAGARNAFKTLFLAAGADATVVGSHLAEMDFKGIQGLSETRIAVLSRVHPVILGVSEGLHGSSLNAGNFSAARRNWADSWIYPTLQEYAAALAPLVAVPSDAELWTTTEDMPILREDAKDAADIMAVQATAVATLTREGWTTDSIKKFIVSGDPGVLEHSGMTSVQLQPPGNTGTAPAGAAAPGTNGSAPADTTGGGGWI